MEDQPPVYRQRLLCVGLVVEVLQASGSFARGTIYAVEDAAETGALYSLSMEDGSTRHDVLEDDMRLYRCGAFTLGDVVRLQLRQQQQRSDAGHAQPVELATIADYDDDSETYTLLRADGRRSQFVEECEILGKAFELA